MQHWNGYWNISNLNFIWKSRLKIYEKLFLKHFYTKNSLDCLPTLSDSLIYNPCTDAIAWCSSERTKTTCQWNLTIQWVYGSQIIFFSRKLSSKKNKNIIIKTKLKQDIIGCTFLSSLQSPHMKTLRRGFHINFKQMK